MTPQLKSAITGVVDAYYSQAQKEYSSFAFNKKPRDHVYKDLTFLKDQLRVRKKNLYPNVSCESKQEVHALANTMMDLKESLSLDQNQIDWTNELFDEVMVFCLKEYPRTKHQKMLKEMLDKNNGFEKDVTEAKRMILARMRNLLLTQNI